MDHLTCYKLYSILCSYNCRKVVIRMYKKVTDYYDLKIVIEKVMENMKNARSKESLKWNGVRQKVREIQKNKEYGFLYNLITELNRLLSGVQNSNRRAIDDMLSCPYGNMEGLYSLINLPKPLYDELRKAIRMDIKEYQEKYYSDGKRFNDFVSKNAENIIKIFNLYYRKCLSSIESNENIYAFKDDEIISIIMSMGWKYGHYSGFFRSVIRPFDDKEAKKCINNIEVEYNEAAQYLMDLRKNDYCSPKLIKEIDDYIKVYNQQYIYKDLRQTIISLMPINRGNVKNSDEIETEYRNDSGGRLNLENTKYTVETLRIIEKWLHQKIMDYQKYLEKKYGYIMKLREKVDNKQAGEHKKH